MLHLDMKTLYPKVKQYNKTKWESMFPQIHERLLNGETAKQIAQDLGYRPADIGRILMENGTSLLEIKQKLKART
jgi:hypothetical protein